MKHNLKIYFIAIITIIVLSSCKEKDKFGSFILTIPEISFTTNPHTYDGAELNLIDTTVLTGLVQRLNQEGLSTDKLTSIKLKSFKVSTTTSGFNFDSFEYSNARLAATGQDTIILANKAPIPHTGLTSVDFDVSYEDLIEYIKQNSIFIRLVTYPNQSLPSAEYHINIEFELKAKLN
jgi:hypothetical protein